MKRWLMIGVLALLPTFSFALSAKAFIVTDMDGTVILSSAADEPRSIASITKLVTVKRNEDLDPNKRITITREDARAGNMHKRGTPLRVGRSYTRAQLIELALVSSDNVAAIALGRMAEQEFVPLPELPENTQIVEASGLDPNNQSTARELAELARSMYNTPTALNSIKGSTEIGKRGSTNPLLGAPGWTFHLSKTGFIRASGGCLVTITQIRDRMMTVVILGSKDTRQRWRDLAELRTMLGDVGFYEPTWTKARTKRHHTKHRKPRT